MNPTKLFVVRHGQSTYNRDQIVSGHVNPPLTELGKEQAAATKAKLAHVQFDHVYSSDLDRAIETAAIIYGEAVPTQNQLKELRERDFGGADGKDSSHLTAIRTRNLEAYKALPGKEKWIYKHAPDMESDHEVSERFVEALMQLAKRHPGQTILVGAHGGTVRTTLIKLGYATADQLPGGSVENAAYVELHFDGQVLSVQGTGGVNKLD